MPKLSLLLGAGFPKWAAGLPVAADLFDFAVQPFGVRDERKLEVVRQAKNSWDVEHPEGLSEEFIAHALEASNKIRTTILWYISRRLSEPYIWREWHAGKWRRHVLMIDENRKYQRAGVALARDFLVRFIHSLSGIVTTNYDLLVEYALGTKLFNYGKCGEVLTGRGPYPVSQWRNPVTLQGSIPLAKMHGSISWDLSGRYTDGRRGITGDALIVAPTPEKTQPPDLAFEWGLAAEVLRDSTHLLVFGSAFNPYDVALVSHLKEHGRNIRNVIVVDTNPRQVDRVALIFQQAGVLALSPPPVPDDTVRWGNWFTKLNSALA